MVKDLDDEIWVDVIGYDGLYQVSNLGRIKSLPRSFTCGQHNALVTTKEKIRKISKHNRGGLCISLCKDGKQKTYKLNKLVYESFVGECTYLSHLDGNLDNCNLDNLIKLTGDEYLLQQKLTGEKIKVSVNKYALIDYGRFSGKHPFVYKIFNKSQRAREFAKEYGYKRSDIIKITKEEYDYIMKFDEEIDVLFDERNRVFI